MDAASADLCGALAAQVDEMPWLVVDRAARRPRRLRRPRERHVLHLTPHALPPEATLALAEAVTDSAPVPPHRLRLAVERSGGNPQLLRDLLRSVGAGEETLPDSIETAALARVDRLAPAERTLVRRAAVLGVAFHPRHLDDVLDPGFPEPDADTWDRLSDVITEMGEGYLRFRRSVVRDAAYAALPFALRRRLHANVAARLATERQLEPGRARPGALAALRTRGRHAGGVDVRAARRRARRRSGSRSPTRPCSCGARWRPRGSLAVSEHRLAETWEALADALAHTGELADAHAALRAARDQARDDPVRTAELLLAHARLAERAGNVPAAVRWANRALRLVDDEREPAAVACRAQTLSVLATVRQREGRFDDAIALCRRVIADAEDGADADPGLAASLAHAWFILDWALYDIGRPEEATHSARRAGDLRAARRPRPPGRGAQQPRRVRLPRGPLARRRRALPARRRGVRARRRHGQRRLRRLQHGRGPQRPGPARRGAPPAAARAADLARVGVRLGHGVRDDPARPRRRARRPPRRGARPARAGVQRLPAAARAARRGAGRGLHRGGPRVRGRPDAALLAADRALRDATRTAPLLHRVRGFALAQLGDEDGAQHALHASLRDAEERANIYEVAVTLDALAALGGAPAGSAARRAALLEQLGVEALPDPPVSPAFRDRRRGSSTVTTPSP